MDLTTEKDCSPLWNLFQQIVTDMKNGTSMWEDFISKATKLHTALKAALAAVSAFLDAFQKVADAATNARGATKDIGTALTRVCLRHKAIENRMKLFISALMDSLISPLGEKTEEWRRGGGKWAQREFTRETKRLRSELVRQQQHAQRHNRRQQATRHHAALQEIAEKKQLLEELEEKAVKAALMEERSRFCSFVQLLAPVVEREIDMLGEMEHLQEGLGQLERHSTDPNVLPTATLEILEDVRACSGTERYTLTRRPSDCSLASSADSESHDSTATNCLTPTSISSEGTLSAHRSQLSQPYCRWRSRDSGFRSEEAFHLPSLPEGTPKFYRNPDNSTDNNSDIQSIHSASVDGNQDSNNPNGGNCGGGGIWPGVNDTAQFERAASAIMANRPHTISAGFEKSHARSPLSGKTFVQSNTPSPTPSTQRREPLYSRPPLPTRCSSLERPIVPARTGSPSAQTQIEPKTVKPNPLPAHLAKEIGATYVNMSELATLAAARANQDNKQVWSESSASESSLESSSGYGSQGHPPDEHHNLGNGSQGGNEQPELAVIEVRDTQAATLHIDGQVATSRDSLSISLSSLEEAVKGLAEISDSAGNYATIKPAIQKRPISMGATYGRRSSVGVRPPPPVRRSSTSSRHNYPITPTVTSPPHIQNSNDNDLPPPPAFLLNPDMETQAAPTINVAETVKQLTELRHMPASPNLTRRNSQTAPQISIFQQNINNFNQKINELSRTPELSKAESHRTSNSDIYGELRSENMTSFGPRKAEYGTIADFMKKTDEIALKNLEFKNAEYAKLDDYNQHYGTTGGKPKVNTIYAQPSQIIAGFNSLCGNRTADVTSPLALRKSLAARSHSADRRGSEQSPSGLIATLSAKLSPQLSPRLTRKSNQYSHTMDYNNKGKAISSGVVQPAFLDKLSATIQQQRKQLDSSKATSVRHIIHAQTQSDPRMCHSSLMEQIKRGATLKRNKHCNDRSAPKIR